MVTRNHARIRRKHVILIIRVGRIINPRTLVIMKRQIIMLVRE
jgi:hypothetical protein